MGSRVWRQAETKKEKEKEKENIMTQYTIGKDGKVKSKGGGKKPITTRYAEGDIPATIPWGIKKLKTKKTPKSAKPKLPFKKPKKKKGEMVKKSKQPKKVWT